MSIASRRRLLTLGATAAGSLLVDPPWRRAHAAASADEPVARLLAGNKRYVSGKPAHPNQSAARRAAVAAGQRPFAAILSCADSRVPPEVLFDQGLGDLFVVRVAGNIADKPAIGSLEFAATALDTRLIMVLGHSRCGAVEAALKTPPGADLSPGLTSLVEAIRPATAGARDKPGDALDHAVRAHVAYVVQQLQSSEPHLRKLASAGKLKVVGAYYQLQSGAVELL